MSHSSLTPELTTLLDARSADPFAHLGRHNHGNALVIRALLPHAESVTIVEGNHAMTRVGDTALFEWHGKAADVPARYRLIWRDDAHHEHITHDPYCFPSQLPDFDLHLFGEGKHWHAYRLLGARVHETDDVAGVLFAVWAPNAERVSVVGDFNRWDGRCHPMRVHGNGVWEIFIPDLAPGGLYKYEVRSRHGAILLKTDPYGRQFELRPNTAAIVEPPSSFTWSDADVTWRQARAEHDWLHTPMSIYEVHLGSWRRGYEGELLNYRELARQLVSYAQEMGFTHLELMPITEHPFDLSWGYQATGYYAPTSRFGTPDDFRWFVDYCHAHDIGVILDWVPAHFPKDAHALARFDGTALYEHEDPRLGEHLDWSTLIFNFGRNEVKNFLISSALFWLEEFHVDGLRVDAVASMLYLDYSRTDWLPNRYGGRENLEAIDFMRELNAITHDQVPGTLIMAEESTSWPQVTRPTYLGGLGFDLKWNMGWMNDTLRYMSEDPIHRQYHQDMLTFSMLYAFTENFLLPFSHDEVTHGKHSLLYRMPGDEWQRFANLRLLYTYMFTHPGKKLLFQGCEFGQGDEWDSTKVLDWYVLEYPLHRGIKQLVQQLNHLYCSTTALYDQDFDWQGFEWIDCHDAQNSVLIYQRRARPSADGSTTPPVIVALNFTPVPRLDYRIGLPSGGYYRELFNSDAAAFGGSDVGNGSAPRHTEAVAWMGRPDSLVVNLPPLAGILLQLDTSGCSESATTAGLNSSNDTDSGN
ncbi:1,4-alpha-glucan branching protein GlgB [Thiospirillum jenense]|uniref:1,4-alpha-glucan branching enzyme GlgB n=1 Tax=Thiospirillum jenense TaxID=1653858 RepID=A0A839HB32_9GAMM|nr:1,4-alpha-glucan branching protein GlgB [Thiospirillum jenense]MBB1126233.1 1,4-alpha-glucan branching protein GlgB [Thiospirillum jenense]